MRCFNHPAAEAVGSCKHCCNGLCAQCARDTGAGITCSSDCEEEIKALRAMIDRSRKMYPLAAKTHSRNAIWFTALALLFLVFGVIAPGIHVQLLDRIWSPHASGCRIFGLQQPPNCEAVIPGCPKVTST